MKKYYIALIMLFSVVFSAPQVNIGLISNEKYITGEDGVIRMYINILGHVESPGTYLVYDGIDIMTLLSISGGFKEGANLDNIIIYRQDGIKNEFSLNDILNGDNNVILNPQDTVYIEQKIVSKIFSSSNVPMIVLSILNLILTIDRTD